MSSNTAVLQQLQQEEQKIQKLQAQVQENVAAQNKCQTQINENIMVQDELERLDESAVVYKRIGPALILQELIEAKDNVAKRLTYIKAESDRLDDKQKQLRSQLNSSQSRFVKLQGEIQSLIQAAGQTAA